MASDGIQESDATDFSMRTVRTFPPTPTADTWHGKSGQNGEEGWSQVEVGVAGTPYLRHADALGRPVGLCV